MLPRPPNPQDAKDPARLPRRPRRLRSLGRPQHHLQLLAGVVLLDRPPSGELGQLHGQERRDVCQRRAEHRDGPDPADRARSAAVEAADPQEAKDCAVVRLWRRNIGRDYEHREAAGLVSDWYGAA